MTALVPIGEFSKMTYLSVKALRHYQDVGLLAPAVIEPGSGYRRYSPAQVPIAQAIRRFRDLDMPIEDIRTVLGAPDTDTRRLAIVGHLERMQDRLAETQAAVASLQALLVAAPPVGDPPVERRSIPPQRVLAVTGRIPMADVEGWLGPTFALLHSVADAAGLEVVGPVGGVYGEDFFQEDAGLVTAFVPVSAGSFDPSGSVVLMQLPALECAVLVHQGPFTELDQTYGALGTYVSEQGIGAPGPIRELYPDDDHAEVCWPITPT